MARAQKMVPCTKCNGAGVFLSRPRHRRFLKGRVGVVGVDFWAALQNPNYEFRMETLDDILADNTLKKALHLKLVDRCSICDGKGKISEDQLTLVLLGLLK